MQNMYIYLGESSFGEGFPLTTIQKVHEQNMGKSDRNEHARQCPLYWLCGSNFIDPLHVEGNLVEIPDLESVARFRNPTFWKSRVSWRS
jgi:hypothetical protein